MGLGNLLLGDEGVGVHALKALREGFPHPGVLYYDGGTRGLTLLPFLEEADYCLLLDAVRAEAPPGTLLELSGEELAGFPPLKLSVHDIALPDLLALLRLRKGDSLRGLALIGVVPERMAFSTELSSTVARALPEMVGRARRRLLSWLGETA
jgi:hydrogenase maturation protease